VTAIQQNPVLLPAAADRAAGVRLKVKDKRPSINNRPEQSIYPAQKSVLRTEATPVYDERTLRLESPPDCGVSPARIRDRGHQNVCSVATWRVAGSWGCSGSQYLFAWASKLRIPTLKRSV
jgi:hypothetical protein